MAQSKQVKEFVGAVCRQVKAKNAHDVIVNELMSHIEDQMLTYIKGGMSEDAAERRTLEQMGNPVDVGESLNQIHRPKHDWGEIIANAVMGIISGGIFIFCAFLGVAGAASMFRFGDYFVGSIMFLGFISFGFFVAFTFVSMFKFISATLFYRSIFKDYERRKKRGEMYGKN